MFEDVAGLNEQKTILTDSLILPFQKRELYNQLVLEPSKIKERKNFLFYGNPGTGKTHLAKSVAGVVGVPFLYAQAPQFLNMYHGEGARKLRELYDRDKGVVFIDEVDAIASKKDRNTLTKDVLVQLLMVLDPIKQNPGVATIAATNMYESLDSAFLSRFPYQLHFPDPDVSQRERLIELQLTYHNHQISSLDSLLSLTDGYDCRKIEAMFSLARQSALRQDRGYLLVNDFR